MLRDEGGNQTEAGDDEREFRPLRSAVIALTVVLFLFAFRPFGMSIDSLGDTLVLLGIVPLNFLIMLGIHVVPFHAQPWRAVVAFGCIIVGNTAYIAAWSNFANTLEAGLAVALVVGLTASFVFLWNRGRIPEQEFSEHDPETAMREKSITLSGESEREVLQLAPGELLFMSADGNYVNVHYRNGAGSATSMLRSSLARLVAQVPGNILVQCHRSHFVHLAAARRIVRSRGRTLIEFDGGLRVPVSRKFEKDLLVAMSV